MGTWNGSRYLQENKAASIHSCSLFVFLPFLPLFDTVAEVRVDELTPINLRHLNHPMSKHNIILADIPATVWKQQDVEDDYEIAHHGWIIITTRFDTVLHHFYVECSVLQIHILSELQSLLGFFTGKNSWRCGSGTREA